MSRALTPKVLTVAVAMITFAACGGGGDTEEADSAPAASAGSASDSDLDSSSTTPPVEPTASEADENHDAVDDGGDTGPVTDPCTLVTADEIAAVLGEPVPGELVVTPEPPLFLGQCEWSIEPTELSVKAIYLSITTTAGLEQGGAGGGGYTAEDQFNGTREVMPDAVDVPGLGDAAFASDSTMADLRVLAGDTLLEISSLKLGSELEDVTPEQLQSLITAALSRI